MKIRNILDNWSNGGLLNSFDCTGKNSTELDWIVIKLGVDVLGRTQYLPNWSFVCMSLTNVQLDCKIFNTLFLLTLTLK